MWIHCYKMLRANFIKEVTVADAEGYHATLLPGAAHDGWGHLIVGNVTGVSGEVKKVLSSSKTDARNPPPVALILTSALARMAANLTMRVTNNDNSESFKSEAEGLAWLDGRMAQFEAKR